MLKTVKAAWIFVGPITKTMGRIVAPTGRRRFDQLENTGLSFRV